MLTKSIDLAKVKLETEWINDRLVLINCDYGYVNGCYDEPTRSFNIGDIFVEADVRRQGLGKKLLEAARQEAIQRGAQKIWAVIVSREGLDSMKSVFGEESISVKDLGDYEHPNQKESPLKTAALLMHMLP